MRYFWGTTLAVLVSSAIWLLIPTDEVTLNVVTADGVLYDFDEVQVDCEGNGHLVVIRVNPDAGVDLVDAREHEIHKVDRLRIHHVPGTTVYVAFSKPLPGVWSAKEFAELAPNHDRTNPAAWSEAFGVPVDLVALETKAEFRQDIPLSGLGKAAKIAMSMNDRVAIARIANRFDELDLRGQSAENLIAVATTHIAVDRPDSALRAISLIKASTIEQACESDLLFAIALISNRRIGQAIEKLRLVFRKAASHEFARSAEISHLARLALCQALLLNNQPIEAIGLCEYLDRKNPTDLGQVEWRLLVEYLYALDDAGRYRDSERVAAHIVHTVDELPKAAANGVVATLIDAGWNCDELMSKGVSRSLLETPKLEEQLLANEDRITTIANARAHLRAGKFATLRGEVERAHRHISAVVKFYEEVGYRGVGRVNAEHEMADLHILEGNIAAATLRARNAVVHEQQGAFRRPGRLAESLVMLAAAYLLGNDQDSASDAVRSAIESARQSQASRRNLTLATCDSLASHLAKSDGERQQHLDSMLAHASREVEETGHPRFMADEAKVRLGQYLAMSQGDDAEIYRRLSAFAARTADTKSPWRREGAALLDVIHYHHLDDYFGIANGTMRMHYVAFLQLPSGEVRRIELGEAEPIDEAIRQWREAMSKRQSSEAFVQELSEMFWARIAVELPNSCRELFLCADWELGAAPWEALPLNDGRQLIDQCIVRRLPASRSRRLLVQYQQAKAVSSSSRNDPSMLLVGNLDYGRSRSPGKTPLWSPLRGTAEELASIRSLAAAPVVSLEGLDATKSEVLERLKDVELAHFATHGYANARWRQPNDSPLESIEHGFGMALSRANAMGMEGSLTALDIARLELPRLELAVLSGCETGIGQPERQIFLSTLHRAFHLAGATNVVASMWQVDDQATQALIQRFYGHYLGAFAGDPAAALRAAQLEIRDDPATFLRPSTAPSSEERAPNFADGPRPLDRSKQPRSVRGPLWSWGAWYASSVRFPQRSTEIAAGNRIRP